MSERPPCSVNSAARVPACLAGSAGSTPARGARFVSLAQQDPERRSTKPEVARSNRAGGTSYLGIAKRSKAAVCKSAGVKPSLVRIQFPSPFPGSLAVERLAVNQEVRGSNLCRGANSTLGVAQWVAHLLWEHGVVRSSRTTETRSTGCGERQVLPSQPMTCAQV